MNITLARAMKTAFEARVASASVRRLQMAQLRTTVYMHAEQNSMRRRHVSDTLVGLRAGCVKLRADVRARLRQIGGRASPAAQGTTEDAGGASPVHQRVLDLLEGHPDGLRVQEIGNELGIDWRSVRPVVAGLVARGAIVQIGQDYYPAPKASRPC